ncbi:MAG: hypothetical protein LBP53_01910 [Candidatus Peribacteria bacterium]|jgi:hypothetical protein|nr:hypothetical protein [Candidatus Peribacteria bacterium]
MVWPQRETVNWVRIGLVSEDEQLVNSFEKAIWAFNATHSGLRLDFTLASGECDGSDEVANNPKSR